jgi:RNA polymerase-binding transcription factor DksA
MSFAARKGRIAAADGAILNTPLSAASLLHFAQVLHEREAQLRLAILERRQRAASEKFTQVASEAPDVEDAALADLVSDLNNAELERDVDELREIEAALGRIAAGSYGICLQCGNPIPRERLEAFPAAKYDVQHQEEHEKQVGSAQPPSL